MVRQLWFHSSSAGINDECANAGVATTIFNSQACAARQRQLDVAVAAFCRIFVGSLVEGVLNYFAPYFCDRAIGTTVGRMDGRIFWIASLHSFSDDNVFANSDT
jgi:hypothetical protein